MGWSHAEKVFRDTPAASASWDLVIDLYVIVACFLLSATSRCNTKKKNHRQLDGVIQRRNFKTSNGGGLGLEPGQVIRAVLDIKKPAALTCGGESQLKKLILFYFNSKRIVGFPIAKDENLAVAEGFDGLALNSGVLKAFLFCHNEYDIRYVEGITVFFVELSESGIARKHHYH